MRTSKEIEAVRAMISAIGDENFKRYVLGVRHNES